MILPRREPMLKERRLQYRQKPEIAWRYIDGEAVLIDPADGIVFVLNEVGSQVWDLIDKPRFVDEIERKVISQYDVDRERVRRDLQQFLEDLATRSLIEVMN